MCDPVILIITKFDYKDAFFPGTGDINHGSSTHTGAQLSAFPLIDSDNYISVLTRNLQHIHYQFFAEGETNVKTIVPKMKTSLQNCHLFFTALFPNNTLPEHADIVNHAHSFGAIIHTEYSNKVEFVVAGRITDKCMEARGKCNVVWGDWVWDSCFGFEELNHESYKVFKQDSPVKRGNGLQESENGSLILDDSTKIEIELGNIGGEDWDAINLELQEFEESDSEDEEESAQIENSELSIPKEGIQELDEHDWINDLEDAFTDVNPMQKKQKINI